MHHVATYIFCRQLPASQFGISIFLIYIFKHQLNNSLCNDQSTISGWLSFTSSGCKKHFLHSEVSYQVRICKLHAFVLDHACKLYFETEIKTVIPIRVTICNVVSNKWKSINIIHSWELYCDGNWDAHFLRFLKLIMQRWNTPKA